MVDEIAKMTARFCMKLVKPTIKVLLWTYLWILLAGVALANMTAKESVWLYNSIVALSAFLWLWFFVQRFVRMFLKDPGFSFLALILDKTGIRKEQRELNPKADKKLLAPSPEGGLPVGKQGRQWVVIPDKMEAHCLVIGGSGTGKTQCVALPFLGSKSGNAGTRLPSFVVDIKGELYDIAGKPGDKVFNPSDPSAYGYDPFGIVRKETSVQDMTIMANALIPLTPGAEKDEFWISESQTLLAASLLFCWENHASFTESMRTIQSTPVEKFVEAAMKKGSEDVRVMIGHFYKMAPETLSSVFATLSSKTMVFASDPDIQRCFNTKKVIRPEDLLEGKTIFFQIPENRLSIYRHMVQLVIGQFLSFWERQPDGHEPKVNFLIDEGFRIGRLGMLEQSISTLRSKGCRLIYITQSLAQLEELFGQVGARTLADNFSVKVILGCTDPNSQRYISDLIGGYFKNVKSTSSNHQTMKLGGNVGLSRSEQERKLVRPEELARLGDECILLACGGWSRVKKMPYYATKEFQE